MLIGGGVGKDGLTDVTEVLDVQNNSFVTFASDHLKLESPMAILNNGVPLVCGTKASLEQMTE